MRKLPFLYVLIFFICSCKFFHKNSDQLLVTVYGDKLYFSDIKHLLSPDLNSSDSLNLVRQLCEKWAKEQLLLNKAKINLPIVLQNVKNQVESYENSLLIYSYQKELLSQKLDTIVGIDEINSYYKNNLGNFVLNDHIVKVNYIKVKKEVPYLWKLKGLYYKNDEESKFKLEDYCYQFADDYYIEDDWVYVNDIINVLPDSYTSRKLFNEKKIEFFDNDYFYFLYVKKYLNKGNEAPLEMVSSQIQSIIINKRKINFLKNVEMDLYKNALAKNHIKYEKK
ncbi:MAG: hypothetical protein CMP64_01685 [Flavobacteriales bacterium]|nr:hypothetical protein [Flavobacteriales bacterium]|tara:strand:- start:5431 stop:6270 length:840 start_codon:yes stop_codon:yes gene_type:complete